MLKAVSLGILFATALSGCRGDSTGGSSPVSSSLADRSGDAASTGAGTVERSATGASSGTTLVSAGNTSGATSSGSADNAEAPVAGDSSGAPIISGSPAPTVLAGHSYAFQPAVVNSAGKALLFSIENRPRWAEFNSATGELSGIPDMTDVGTYSQISINVSDGGASSIGAPFSIAVVASAAGSATVAWVPPKLNTDGTPISDLAGYRIYYGSSPTTLTQSVDTKDSNIDSYVVNELPQGTWYFEVRAYTVSDVESSASNVASKVIL